MQQVTGTRLAAAPIRLDLRALAQPAARLLAVLALLFVALTWDRHGLGVGEADRQMFGRLLLDAYRSGFSETAVGPLQAVPGGGLFDLAAALVELVWHGNVWDLRHLLSGLAGLAGIFAAWQLARSLGGEVAALLAALILCLTGAWSGAMFTHTREIPLAAALAWALVFQTRLVAELPRPRAGTLLGLGASGGMALGLGAAGWLLPVSLLITLPVAIWRGGARSPVALLGSLRPLLPAALLGGVIALLGRPTMLIGLLDGWLLDGDAGQVSAIVPTLVDGTLLLSSDVPRSYLHTYLVVKLPELMLVGLALALGGRPWRERRDASAAERRHRSRHAHPMHLPLVLAITLPMAYAWLFRPPLADGLRGFLHLLPPMAVAAALGWRMLWQTARSRPVAAWSLAAVGGALAASHLVTLAHLYPYGHAYYNSLVAGLRGAAQGWVLDYDATSVREGAEYLNRWADSQAPASAAPISVAVCGDPVQARAWLSAQFVVVPRARQAAFVIAGSQPGCPRESGGIPVHAVVRQGVVLGQVIDRRQPPG
ncbi:MAG: glycosyltransferase family 39 protein [Rhodocyclaceae bacterium]|nr:glycosyltransferase family 39 protein [Rhodocyclaceae bacterium]